jgi:predicted methyltransferase
MRSKSSIARLKEHQAIVAVVREMLTIINEMLRNREEYRGKEYWKQFNMR